ncbi:MAG: ABC transporter ATP-binding protein, partial [Thermodesulfovibrionia bacterium]|nr:ABC transporter ATP-binding protein [Thermodesulfovibrionia bacterium]
VWQQLKELKSKGITQILTTHYMEEAEKLCDRVAIMDSGTIITIDTPLRLMEIHGGGLESVYLKLTGKRLIG